VLSAAIADNHATKENDMPRVALRGIFLAILPLAGLVVCQAAQADDPAQGAKSAKRLPPPADEKIDFAKHVAPILQRRCLACHGAEKQQSGLRLDSRASALQGGNSGAVVVPGKSGESRLIHVVAGVDADEVVMPPEGERLTTGEIALLRAWIDQGAAWPKGLVLVAEKQPPTSTKHRHWAYQPLRRPALPQVRRRDWPRNAIDHFVLSRLEAEGIAPAPEASRETLVRRVTLDLIGLPPTPEEVAAFVNDRRPNAYERLVDRLLASPHYGEKWARPWLDLCHYGDSDGYLQDFLRPYAWRYRDWLVDALNRDLPFDEFTIQQLAGDLLPGSTAEQKTATGFLRQTLSNREGGADLEEYRVEKVVDRTQTVATAFLGMTVGCARCHDHKYDPISQKEFYQFYAFFDGADEINIDHPLPGELEPYLAKKQAYERKRRELLGPWQAALAELQTRWEKKLLEAVARPGKDQSWDREWEVLGLIWGQGFGEGQLEGTQIVLLDRAKRTAEQQDKLQDYFLKYGQIVDPDGKFKDFKPRELSGKLEALRAELPPLSRAQTMMETQNPRAVHIHVRGDFRRPGVPVAPATPAVLPPLHVASRQRAASRLELGHWLVSPGNPLTARVTVNRMWQEFFGTGLTATSEDLGTQGERPTHPALLDWLAAELRQRGWSIKAMHRLIVTSATYRQSSSARPELSTRDPSNRLLARQASLRLSAEAVRDGTLAVSGLLSPRIGGPSVRPPQPESVAMEGFDNKWTTSAEGDRYRRGLYTFIQRLSPFAQNVTFDAPAPGRICTRRERSNTPLQALTLLNDPVFFEAAQALAARIAKDGSGDVGTRVEQAFTLCLGRVPTAREKQRLVAYVKEQRAILTKEPQLAAKMNPKKLDGVAAAEAGAWTCLASILLNLHEFITRD
jgi:hypothetical protein